MHVNSCGCWNDIGVGGMLLWGLSEEEDELALEDTDMGERDEVADKISELPDRYISALGKGLER